MGYILLISFVGMVSAQNQPIDSILIKASLIKEKNELLVEQTFNLSNQNDTIFLHAWINAYSKKNTALSNSKLEERKSDLYYAKPEQRGQLIDLELFNTEGEKLNFEIQQNEKVVVFAKTNKIIAKYKLKLPDSSFTGYGHDNLGNYFLKYFFLQPLPYFDEKFHFQPHLDMETEMSNPTFYDIQLLGFENYKIFSYLNNENQSLRGLLKTIPEITVLTSESREFTIENKKIRFTYPYKESEYTHAVIKNQLQFLEKYLGELPYNELIITQKIKNKNSFFGLDDITISEKLKLENFSSLEKEAIQLFQLICYEYLNQVMLTNKQNDFWIKGGLQSYLSINYIETAFQDVPKLMGKMYDRKILGLPIFRSIYLFQLPLTERYNLMYLFLSRFGNDQVLDTPFEKMTKFNQEYVGNHRTGMIFKSMDEYLGQTEFRELTKKFISENNQKLISREDYFSFLESNASKPTAWFKQNFIETDQNIDFRLKKIKRIGDSLSVVIKNRTNYEGPFKISGYNGANVVYSKWLNTKKKEETKITISRDSMKGLLVNLDSYMPELYDHDNYKIVGGLFHNRKKVSLTIIRGVEDPRYNQFIFIPKTTWNNQDKLLVSLGISNNTFLPKQFTYRITPTYSFGTGKLLGSVGLGYFLKWKTGLIDKLTLNSNYSYFNFSQTLSVQSLGGSAGVMFRRKNPRENVFNGVSLGIQSINRELPLFPTVKDLDYKNYQLYELNYFYANNGYIHDFSGEVGFEYSNLFNKLNLETYYRVKLSQKSRLNYRLFGGFFLNNNTNSDSFDYGVSRVNDYKFRYQILDRVNTENFFAQQFILADAGFKSLINQSVNQWIVSNNLHLNLNKRIGVFTDFAWLKNENQNPNFIYDSGLSLIAVEDFLELYFPIQSSLGFEPNLGNYQNRIRFVFTFRLNTILNYWRRGKY